MKKIIFSAVAVIAFVGTSFSQKATLDNPWSLEGVLSYSTPGGINWNAPTVRVRYFVNDNIAARVQLGLGDGLGTPLSESYTFYENADGTGEQGTLDINRMNWNAQIGGEYHLTGTDRMSPYFGLGINFGGGSQKQEGSNYDPGTDDFDANYISYNADGKFSMFGASLFAGMDFYVFQNLYVGLELGIRYATYNYSDQSGEVVLETPDVTITNVAPGRKESYLSTGAASAAFRLGWRF